MFGLSYQPSTRKKPVSRRLNLEELERRETPAPVGPALPGVPGPLGTPLPPTSQSPALTNSSNPIVAQIQAANAVPFTPFNGSQSPAFPVEGSASFSNQFALGGPAAAGGFGNGFNPGISQLSPLANPGSVTLGLPTVPVGSVSAAPFLFSSPAGAFLTPPGTPNPVRLSPTAALTVAADTRTSPTQWYISEDINLSGGGGQPTEDQVRPNEAADANNPQLRLEASATDTPDGATQVSPNVLREALLQVGL